MSPAPPAAGLGHPIGPFKLKDVVTSRLVLEAQEIMHEAYGERFRPRPLLKLHCIQGALPLLKQGGGGSIVAITSAGLARHPPLDILSVAPKAGVDALIRGVAREEGRYGVRANTVAPGVIDAGLFARVAARVDPVYVDAARRNTALKRFGTVADTANAVVFLASSMANLITGQRLAVDGGYTV